MSSKIETGSPRHQGFFAALKTKFFSSRETATDLHAVKTEATRSKDSLQNATPQENASRGLATKNESTSLQQKLDTPVLRMHCDWLTPADVKSQKPFEINGIFGPTMNAAQLERFLQESVSIAPFAARQEKTMQSTWNRYRGRFDMDVTANTPFFAVNLAAALRTALRDVNVAKKLDSDPRWKSVRDFNEQSVIGRQLHDSLYQTFHMQPRGTIVSLFKTSTTPQAPDPSQAAIRYAVGKRKPVA